ncbi:VOC family protein [Vibrio tapetis subsp. quintayensis]|uniref:VOC family protein n=1 Tax=Vibrio tapetis TaxID=52443 RepID=UPI0025B324A8|nr:VOC family protein [Vibrio tapetis]MDN3681066.1 VOC family protein [Vibrio tapetis subsp. quintayensis]
MELGAHSISLNVKDLQASKAFYEKLGFVVTGGDEPSSWLILKNGQCIIGLFQGMFEKNILTFNPGWNNDAEETNPFTDVRQLQETLKQDGVEFVSQANTQSTGPASFIIEDPDGNPILVDQHR